MGLGNTRATEQRTALIGAAVAGVLIFLTSVIGGFSPLTILFMAWALAPYVLLLLVARKAGSVWVIGGAAVAAVVIETAIRVSVFVFPSGSTAAIALVFSPVLIGAIAMPCGAIVGALVGVAFRRGGMFAGVPAVLVAGVALGYAFIAFARPELLPSAVAARRAALESIGEPRIVTGAEAFEYVTITDKSAWHQAGEFDGAPGDEIAVIDHSGIDLIDPVSLQPRGHVALGGNGRLWNWYSRLARMGDRLVVVQSGGGYQETEVRSLDNALLWRYRPDVTLPPSRMLPGDLDADGELEFYAATSGHVVRLDGAGREMWRQPASQADLVDVVAPGAAPPAWIAGIEFGRHVRVWDPGGAIVGTLPWPGEPVLGIIDWAGSRAIVHRGPRARALKLDGTPAFDVAIGEHVTLSQAVAISWNGQPALAMAAAAPQTVGRARLKIVNANHEVLYDEVMAQVPRLIVARTAAGESTLLVSGASLRVLRPRTQSATAR